MLLMRNGWGATIVDGLDTLLIAGLTQELFAGLNFTLSIDFTSADGLVNTFETIIRYVGGLVSVVDLLEFLTDAPQYNTSGLISQAEVLVNKLAPGYLSFSIHVDLY